ncbi:MAG: hypothetical protein U0270_36375 [Labilithrix sp.]
MAKAHDAWKVYPHRPIEKLSENLWRVEGELDDMPLGRIMTLARMTDGSVVVHNAIALEEPLMKEIEAWGPPRHILVPNGFHRLDARVFKERYPSAKVYAPAGSRAKVEEVVPVDGTYEDFVPDSRVSLETLDGIARSEGVLMVRDAEEVTLVLNDAVFNCPHVKGFKGFVLNHLTASTGGPKVSRIFKLFLMKDRKAFRAHLERLADTPSLTRIIVSHRDAITSDPAATLRAVAATLT